MPSEPTAEPIGKGAVDFSVALSVSVGGAGVAFFLQQNNNSTNAKRTTWKFLIKNGQKFKG